MKKLTILGLIFTILVTSCKRTEKDLELEHIVSTIEAMDFPGSIKWVVILPGLGCHGCIQEGEAFMKDYIDTKEILFVLTKVESMKILQQKIGIKLTDYPNVLIDHKEAINIPSNNSVYPCVVHLDEKDIKFHEFQSPGNNAFEKLRQQIAIADDL